MNTQRTEKPIGIFIDGCTDVVITGNKFQGDMDAIRAINSSQLHLSDNTIHLLDSSENFKHLAESIASLEIDIQLKKDLLSKLAKVESTPSKNGKIERYKSFLELINLHKEVILPAVTFAANEILSKL
ncbi:hypothetical protein CYR40_05580 [Chimaeribacter arupi]|uniref:hypothetical protein n=1 Tax=Chimaeribacter arupi TaxID=2060066 RepID=UPI000C7E6C16|nr:hypothetical protein [Chimaeribacter arupi]PLR48639.1 hypothetical protein CYR40_05580 [Chimaeribacter arupi]